VSRKSNWILGLNVSLGALAFRELLRLQPQMYSAASSWTREVEEYLFVPSETAPLLVVLLSFWLVYRRRQALFALPRESGPGWLAALWLAIAIVAFGWSVYTNSPDLQVFALIATVIGGAILWRGKAAVRVLRLPLLLLLFAVPVPSPLLSQLVWLFQSGTAVLSGWYLNWLGIPALVSTHIIRISDQTFQVIEGCSGLRSVETLAMLTVLMVDLFGRRGAHAACLILISIPVAFLMNSLRVLTLILNPHSAIQAIHTAQGIVILMAGLIILYLLDGLLARVFGETSGAAPGQDWSQRSPGPSAPESAVGVPKTFALTACLLVMLLTSFVLPQWDAVANRRGWAMISETVPRDIDDWTSEDLPRPNETLQAIAISQVLNRRYTESRSDRAVDLFVAVGNHLDRFRSTYSPKTAFPGRGWIIEEEGVRSLRSPDRDVSWIVLRSGTRRLVVYHWYDEPVSLATESLRSLLALDRSPFQRELPIMTFRLATALPERTPESLARAHSRMESLYRRVSRGVGAFKRATKGDAAISEVGALVYPLWERVFRRYPIGRFTQSSEIRGLREETSMA